MVITGPMTACMKLHDKIFWHEAARITAGVFPVVAALFMILENRLWHHALDTDFMV